MTGKILTTANTVHLDLTLRRYQAWGPDAANRYDGHRFSKVFRCRGRLYLLQICQHNGAIKIEVLPRTESKAVWQEAEEFATHILGLAFPLKEFYRFAPSDPVLNDLTKRFRGLRPTLTWDLFEMLVTSITAQQINLRFAFTIRSRLIRRYGERLRIDGKTFFAFPTPAKLARVRVATLRKMQFSDRKAEYIIDIARQIVQGSLDLEALRTLSDEAIYDKLLPVRGIGRWTVDWLLARALGRGEAIAAGDLGVRKAIQHFYFDDAKKSELELRSFAQRWGQFANLAVHYLLMGLMNRN